MQIAIAYNEAFSNGRLNTTRGEIVKSTFLGSLKKRVEEVLSCSLDMTTHLRNYIKSGKWPSVDSSAKKSDIILSWYIKWYNVPSPLDIRTVLEKLKCNNISTSVPLLRLLFPRTHIAAINVINGFLLSFEDED